MLKNPMHCAVYCIYNIIDCLIQYMRGPMYIHNTQVHAHVHCHHRYAVFKLHGTHVRNEFLAGHGCIKFTVISEMQSNAQQIIMRSPYTMQLYI